MNTIEKIKNLGIFILIVTAVVSCENTNRGTDLSVEDKEVEALLQKMTLEEKAGQMTNISLMALAKGDFWMRRDTVELDTAKMNELLLKKHVGSVQNLGTYPFKPAEWRKNIAQIQNSILEKSRLNITFIY